MEHLQTIHLARKLHDHERQKHSKDTSNIESNHARPNTSPKYLETSDPIRTKQDYHTSMFNMSQNRYSYPRELIETYQQKLSLNHQNTKIEEKGEEDEEVIVDTDTDVNMIGTFENQRESPNETSNVPEDLSKNSRKRNHSSEDSNRYHPYAQENKVRVLSPVRSQSPKEQDTRQSPNAAVASL